MFAAMLVKSHLGLAAAYSAIHYGTVVVLGLGKRNFIRQFSFFVHGC